MNFAIKQGVVIANKLIYNSLSENEGTPKKVAQFFASREGLFGYVFVFR